MNIGKLKQAKTRTVDVPLLLQDETTGEWYEETTPVEFYSDTPENHRERFKDVNLKESDLVDLLALRVKAFPQILDDDGNPAEVTKELLLVMHSENLKRISDRILEAINPKKFRQDFSPVT